MNILQYNIYGGCKDSKARLRSLANWIGQGAWDVVGLNELLEWNQDAMTAFARACGFEFSEIFIMRDSPYYVGVMSRHKIKRVNAVEEHFHHGVLQVEIKGIDFLITHLSPVDAVRRKDEVVELLKLIDAHKPTILMGDLNTLSSRDAQFHEHDNLLKTLGRHSSLRRKFISRDEIDYEVMDMLLGNGLYDVCPIDEDSYSVPTRYNNDFMHAAQMRLDYILLSSALLKQHPLVTTVRDEAVETLSDHYPVSCLTVRNTL